MTLHHVGLSLNEAVSRFNVLDETLVTSSRPGDRQRQAHLEQLIEAANHDIASLERFGIAARPHSLPDTVVLLLLAYRVVSPLVDGDTPVHEPITVQLERVAKAIERCIHHLSQAAVVPLETVAGAYYLGPAMDRGGEA